jgi:uncharacterized protein
MRHCSAETDGLNFILDGMLGKLARWLRMMGYDAKYSTTLQDNELLAIAKQEKRVLFTRDLALYQQASAKGVEAFYVEGTTEPDRLAEISARFGIAIVIDLEHSRCPKCNTKLAMAPKEEIAEKIEKNTLIHYSEFWRCLNCGAVYWQGAHWIKIRATLEEAKIKAKKKKEA